MIEPYCIKNKNFQTVSIYYGDEFNHGVSKRKIMFGTKGPRRGRIEDL
jgi:hypothetical protein